MQLTLSRHTPCTIYGATATLRHYMNTAAQRRLLNSTLPPGVCAPNSAFVTLIANETYVSGALCLKKSMARVRSACPMILVVADPLPADAMAALEAEYKASHIQRLSELRLALDQYEQRQLARMVKEDEQRRADGMRRLQQQHQQQPAAAPARLTGGKGKGKGRGAGAGGSVGDELRNTRQLHRAGGWARRTHQKLLLFALRGYQRLAFLDIDMLVTRNIDALLEPALVPGPFAAVAALPYSTSSFNSGVFVFEPSMATAAVLDDLSHRATFRPVRATTTGASAGMAPSSGQIRIRAAGERFQLTDQSILNHHFQRRWHSLPFGYNLGVKVRQVVPKLWGKVEPAIIHYVHRPKPWEETLADPDSAMSRLVRRLGIEPLTRAWRYRCLGAPPGDLDALSAADRAALFA